MADAAADSAPAAEQPYSSKDLLDRLAPKAVLHGPENGMPAYYECNHSGLAASQAYAAPRCIFDKRMPADNNTRLVGAWLDVNCFLAWLSERKAQMPQDVYDFIVKTYLKSIVPAGFSMAPPSKLLSTKGGKKNPEEWHGMYRSPSFTIAVRDAPTDWARKQAEAEEKRRAKEAKKAAAAAADPAPAISASSSSTSVSSSSSSSSATPKQKKPRAQKVKPAAAPVAPLAASPVQLPIAIPDAPVLFAPKKKASTPRAKKVEASSAVVDAIMAHAAAAAAVAPAPKKKRSAAAAAETDGEAKVKVSAAKKSAVVPEEIKDKLPSQKKVMTVNTKKVKGSAEVPNWFSQMSKVFVGSATDFQAPSHMGLFAFNKGTLSLMNMAGKTIAKVEDVHMANAEL